MLIYRKRAVLSKIINVVPNISFARQYIVYNVLPFQFTTTVQCSKSRITFCRINSINILAFGYRMRYTIKIQKRKTGHGCKIYLISIKTQTSRFGSSLTTTAVAQSARSFALHGKVWVFESHLRQA